MEFTEIEIELSNGLFAYVSGEYEPYYEDNSFDYEYGSIKGTHDPCSGWVAAEIKITSTEVWRDGERCDDWSFDELEDKLEAHLNKELEGIEP